MNQKTPDANGRLFSSSDGQLLVGAVRDTIENYLRTREPKVSLRFADDSRFETKLGCFVTLKNNDKEKSLRGCIGFAEPVYKFSSALTQASIAAATEDPRFPPVKLDELDDLLVDVSILTQPTLINVKSPRDLPREIKVGEDGLILRWSVGSGLLLPQVAREYNWDAEEFLCNLSMKAGAPPDEWLVPGTQILKFQALVFNELTPKGKVELEKA